MTQQDLKRWEDELRPLVALDGASPLARKDALAFNADVSDVKSALLEPARRMLDRGSVPTELSPCLERTVVELAFWRRVLVAAHRGELGGAEARPDLLVQYLLS